MKYAFKAKVLVLNWPEDIVHLRFGWLQAICFNLCVLLVKARGGKIIWICHNRKSHAKGKPLLSKWNRNFFKHIADKIIVHSKDAIEVLKEVRSKVVFVPHPRYERIKMDSITNPNTHQALIWGNITPYKGLEAFINDYKKSESNFPVKILGKGNPEYVAQLKEKAAGTNIHIQNTRLTAQELQEEFNKCSVIVLPYKKTDTFSSGALIHSLNAHKIILGPRVGNFIDLAETGACIAYQNNKELFELLDRMIHDSAFYQEQLENVRTNMDQYYKLNTWENMIEQVLNSIETTKEFALVKRPMNMASLKNQI
ncbi:glycosyltransferase [Cnuella takakiae]|uniref:glycosyltransferase n=1 Tax=Cnuella takakiae TaxID=1302690 RepID=UPI00116043B3|nr:glycosyltransferase [Cnuella takakiae]